MKNIDIANLDNDSLMELLGALNGIKDELDDMEGDNDGQKVSK